MHLFKKNVYTVTVDSHRIVEKTPDLWYDLTLILQMIYFMTWDWLFNVLDSQFLICKTDVTTSLSGCYKY